MSVPGWIAFTVVVSMLAVPAQAAPVHYGAFSGAEVGYIGCVHDPSRRSAPFFSVCMTIYAQEDGIHVEATGVDEVIAPTAFQYSYYERAVVPSASLTVDESGAIPALIMDFVLPRTGHVQLTVESYGTAYFGKKRTVCSDESYIVDSEGSGTHTRDWGTINGRWVRERSECNIYFVKDTSAIWARVTPLEREG